MGDAGPEGHVNLAVPLGEGLDPLVPHDAPTIHLIAVGDHPARPAAELRAGDVVVFNYGSTAEIRLAWDNGRGTVGVDFGEGPSRRYRAETLVAVRP